jgi:hypothetical protein
MAAPALEGTRCFVLHLSMIKTVCRRPLLTGPAVAARADDIRNGLKRAAGAPAGCQPKPSLASRGPAGEAAG